MDAPPQPSRVPTSASDGEGRPAPLPNLDVGNGLGNNVIVDMSDGRFGTHAHVLSVKVRVGECVRRGQLLGQVGDSGGSDAPHLHFHSHAACAAASATISTGWKE